MDVVRVTLDAVSPTVPAGAAESGGLMTVKDLAEYLNVSDKTIRQWCAQGRIPHGKLEGNIRFDHDQIQRWLDERWHPGGT